MPFTPHDPHVTVAIVLGKMFWQFADPLDWMAKHFGVETSVDRYQLMESVAMLRVGGAGINKAYGEATGTDKRTRFRMQVFGRCEGRMVALCGMTISPYRVSLQHIEETAVAMCVMNVESVLGVQATHGLRDGMLDGVEHADKLMRLMPVNVFNRAFFRENIEILETAKSCKVVDTATASMVTLTKPWLFYDVPQSGRRKKRGEVKLLPFS
jgi:hypothetical protein